jgi:hypothetical protein
MALYLVIKFSKYKLPAGYKIIWIEFKTEYKIEKENRKWKQKKKRRRKTLPSLPGRGSPPTAHLGSPQHQPSRPSPPAAWPNLPLHDISREGEDHRPPPIAGSSSVASPPPPATPRCALPPKPAIKISAPPPETLAPQFPFLSAPNSPMTETLVAPAPIITDGRGHPKDQ